MPFTFNFGGFDPSAFGGFGGGEASQPQRPRRERKPRKAIGNAFTRTLINLGVTLLFGLGYFYFELPALNFHAEEFYVFLFLLCAVYCVCAVITSGFQGEGVKGYFGFVKKQCTIPFFVLVALIAAIVIGGLTSWVVLRAGSYSKLLSVQTGDFATEVEEISYDQIPMLDEDSAARLSPRSGLWRPCWRSAGLWRRCIGPTSGGTGRWRSVSARYSALWSLWEQGTPSRTRPGPW